MTWSLWCWTDPMIIIFILVHSGIFPGSRWHDPEGMTIFRNTQQVGFHSTDSPDANCKGSCWTYRARIPSPPCVWTSRPQPSQTPPSHLLRTPMASRSCVTHGGEARAPRGEPRSRTGVSGAERTGLRSARLPLFFRRPA